MAYDSTNKKLYADAEHGISTSEIAVCLGDYRVTARGRDIGLLCTSPGINKMSKRKPIRYPSYGKLTDAQFEGTASDMADNIHFGIKINGPVNAEIGPTLVEIHDTTFEYLRPRGIAYNEPFRILDFDGYRHNAMANPGASFQLSSREGGILQAFYNDDDFLYGSLGGISVQYDNTNTDGVDFTEMYKDNAETIENALKRSYPCILVTDSKGVSYFTALDYPSDDGSAPAARPLYYNDAYQRASNWSVRFGKPRLVTGIDGSTAKPWNSAQEGMRATLFLVKSADTNGPYLDIAKTMNFAENWIPIVFPILVSGKPIVLPADVLGAPLALSQYGAARIYFEPTGVTYNDPFLTVEYSQVGTTDETVTVEVTVQVSGGAYSATKSSSVSPGGFMMIPAFQASDFGLATFIGGEYTVKVTIKTTDSQGATSKTGTYQFTA